MSFDQMTVLRVLNNNDVKISLDKAMMIAAILMDWHSERVCEVESNAYQRGLAEGKEQRLTNQEAFELGKLRRMREVTFRNAREMVGGIVETHGRDKKIQCIKALRERTGLGLKETKDIVEEWIIGNPPF
jgi:ribosomal protein L7/L12